MRTEEEGMTSENLADLYGRARHAAEALHAQAKEVQELTERLERLTKDTPAWYAGTRARVEAGGQRNVRPADHRENLPS
jgi:hypothetical protein